MTLICGKYMDLTLEDYGMLDVERVEALSVSLSSSIVNVNSQVYL